MARTQEEEVLRIQLLGGFRVWVGTRSIADVCWRRRKAAALIKVLALTPQHRLHREEVLDLLWPELAPRAAENNLHRTLHIARHALEPDLHPGEHSPYLCLAGDLLVFCPEVSLKTDVDAYVEAAAIAQHREDPCAYQAAVGFYSGDLLPEDRYEEWTVARREELRRLYHDLLRCLSRLYERRGERAEGIEILQRLLISEPADEEAHTQLMRLYALAGQRHRALQQYQRLLDGLREETDAEPDAGAKRLYDEIRERRFPATGPGVDSDPVPATIVSPPSVTEEATSRPWHAAIAANKACTDLVPPNNLPAYLNSFVGRDRDLAEVTALLCDARLVSLTGTVGVGKSRLAVQVAAAVRYDYPDGVWLVQLAALSDARLVPSVVAGALSLRERPDRPMVDALVDAVRSRRILLLLDNAEHLLEACAALTEVLLASCPDLHILVTSRRRFGIPGERVWPVPSLTIPPIEFSTDLDRFSQCDAVSLFLDRARENRPSFILTPENAPSLREVCRQLDGIPLAIELAAARMRVLTVGQVAERLSDCFTVLGSGSDSPPSRHRTLRGTMDWSYDLLGEREQTLLRRLAVFAGGCTLEAVEEVCSGGEVGSGDVLDVLATLVDYSLLVIQKQGMAMRYRLLEPLRQYAMGKLQQAGEEEQLRRRHAEWCESLARKLERILTGPQQTAALDRLEVDHDNLRVALHWLRERDDGEPGLQLVASLCRFWWLHGHWTEGRRWLETMLDRTLGDGGGLIRAKALSGAGVLAYSQGDPARASILHQEALALYREAGDLRGMGIALHGLGRVAHYRADFSGAGGLYAESLTLRRELHDPMGIAICLLSVASVERDQGNYDRAARLADESLELYRDLADNWGEAMALDLLGQVARVRGKYQEAERLYEESLELYRELGDTRGVAINVDNLARIALDGGDLTRAEALHEECLRLYRHLNDAWSIAATFHHLGQDAYYRAEFNRARELVQESLTRRRRLGDIWGMAHSLLTLGRVTLADGDPSKAISFYGESLALYRKVGDRLGLTTCLEGLAGAMIDLGDTAWVARAFGAAEALRVTLGTPLPPIDCSAQAREVAETRARLGEARFAVAWQDGQKAPFEDVVVEAVSFRS